MIRRNPAAGYVPIPEDRAMDVLRLVAKDPYAKDVRRYVAIWEHGGQIPIHGVSEIITELSHLSAVTWKAFISRGKTEEERVILQKIRNDLQYTMNTLLSLRVDYEMPYTS